MNSENESSPPPESQPETPPDAQPQPLHSVVPPQPDDPKPGTSPELSTWRHNGKVARLPKALRHKINLMIEDGSTYPDIIASLGAEGEQLNTMNLSRWKDTGYKDWVLEQSWLRQLRSRQEPATSLAADFDATQITHAALQIATLQIFEAFRELRPEPAGDGAPIASRSRSPEAANAPAGEAGCNSNGQGGNLANSPQAESPNLASHPLGPEQPKVKNGRRLSQLDLRLGGDSSAFVRLLNALARASREAMLVQKYREACVQARGLLSGLKDPDRKLTERETQAIVRKVDEVLGFC